MNISAPFGGQARAHKATGATVWTHKREINGTVYIFVRVSDTIGVEVYGYPQGCTAGQVKRFTFAR